MAGQGPDRLHPRAHATRDPWPLGTFKIVPKSPTDCPSLFSCQSFVVSGCPSVNQSAAGELAIGDATTPQPAGVVALYSGNTGGRWWGSVGSPDAFLLGLRDAGMTVVMVCAWAFGLWRRNGGWTDVFWTWGTGLSLATAALTVGGWPPGARQLLVAAMALAWSLRLGLYLTRRW